MRIPALESLEVHNFRAFRHLGIEHLGRVNLFVGRNSVGKTSILEALKIYADRGSVATIWETLVDRGESRFPRSSFPRSSVERVDAKELVQDVRYLFFGRGQILTSSDVIEIGPIGDKERRLSIVAQWYVDEYDRNNRSDDGGIPNEFLRISTRFGQEKEDYFPIYRLIERYYSLPRKENTNPHIFVSAGGIEGRDIAEWWDKIALTPHEEPVIDAIRLIVPNAERLSVVGSRMRTAPIVRITGIDSPLPLRSLGEGLQRIFGIALALVNAQDGFLLVDEIESGLHYTALLGLWRLVLQTARRINVQVFATTHSWDCIEAFQQATREDQQEEGVLIRLGRRHDEIIATTFDEDELAIATRERIEVR